MKHQPWYATALLLGLIPVPDEAAQPPLRGQITSTSEKARLIERTEAALLDQIRCQHPLQVGRAINTMRRNRLIHYSDNENGSYYFAPNEPLKLLGFRITKIIGTDVDRGFDRTPESRMVGTAPSSNSLEIEVIASRGELRARALEAGLVEAITQKGKNGFEIWPGESYRASRARMLTSRIACLYYSPLKPD